MGSRAEAEADPGWSQLVEFLSVAGLKDGSLERALALLAANDVTDLVTLRRSFTSLASELRKGPRALISRATRSLQLVPSVGRSSRASSSRGRHCHQWPST